MGKRAGWLGTLKKFIHTLEHVYKRKRGYKLSEKLNHQSGQKYHFCVQFRPKFSKIGLLFIGSPSKLRNIL